MSEPCSPTIGQTLPSTTCLVGTCQGSARSRKLIAEQYGVFTEAVQARLAAGAETYGDASLDRPTSELIEEAEQEALDIDGWGFFVWQRIQRLKAKMAEIERRTT